MQEAFSLSERFQTPVIVRETRSFAQGVESVDVPEGPFPQPALGLVRETWRFVPVPRNVVAKHRALHRRIVHAHAKDARRASPSRAAQEVPLGHGDIDWLEYLGILEEIEYRGWLTVEREVGDNRVADVAAGVAFLRRLVG